MIYEIIKRNCLSKRNIIVGIFLLVLLCSYIYQGKTPLISGFENIANSYPSLTLNEKIKMHKIYGMDTIVDKQYIQTFENEYHAYVDTNRKSDEDLIQTFTEFKQPITKEEIPSVLYDFSNRGLVLSQQAKNEGTITMARLLHMHQLIEMQQGKLKEFRKDVFLNSQGDGTSKPWGIKYNTALNALYAKEFDGKKLRDGDTLGWNIWINSHRLIAMTLGILLIFMLYPMFNYDRKRKLDKLIYASKNRNNYIKSTIFAGLIMTISLFVIFEIIVCILCLLRFGLHDGTASVFAVFYPIFTNTSYFLLTLKTILFSLLATITFASIIMFLSSFLSGRATLILTFFYLIISTVIRLNGVKIDIRYNDFLYNLSPATMMTGVNFFLGGNNFMLGNVLIPSYFISILMCMGLLILSFFGIYKIEKHTMTNQTCN